MESNKLLKDLFLTVRNDYAGWEAKQARHNPSPFVTMLGQAYYDRRMSSLLVLQAVSHLRAARISTPRYRPSSTLLSLGRRGNRPPTSTRSATPSESPHISTSRPVNSRRE